MNNVKLMNKIINQDMSLNLLYKYMNQKKIYKKEARTYNCLKLMKLIKNQKN